MRIGRIGPLRKNTDSRPLFRECDRVHVAGKCAQDLRLDTDGTEPAPDCLDPRRTVGNDQGLALQPSERQLAAGLLRQRMPCRQDRHPGFSADTDPFQLLRVIRRSDHRDIDQPPVQLFRHFVAAAVPEREFHQRKFLPEAGDPACGEIGCAALHLSDPDLPRHLLVQRSQVLPGVLHQFQDLLGSLEQDHARVRQLQPASAADEQLNAQVLLQLPDLRGERRLADVKLAGSVCDVLLPGNRVEILKRLEIHKKPLFTNTSAFKGIVYPALSLRQSFGSRLTI